MAKLGLVVRPILLLSIASTILYASPAFSAPDEVEWSQLDIPGEGTPGGWVLARNSDVRHLTTATDGTLYAYANPSGTSHTLFRSTNGGCSWSHTGSVTDEIIDIAADPEDDDTVYYATTSCVYKSSDGGDSFTELPPSPGGAGSNNLEITAITMASLNGHNIIAVGTQDTDDAEYGGIYILEEEEPFPSWVDTEIGNYDIYAVAFSPDLATDAVTVAAVTDETRTYVAYNYGTPGD